MTNDNVFHEQKEFKNIDYSEKTLRNRDFNKCKFIDCYFTQSDLRTNNFDNCFFENCNFTMTVVEGVGFRDATFKSCKILGVDFSQCNIFLFSFHFDNCIMDYCTFYGRKLKKTNFVHCLLKNVDFSETDLTSSVFSNSDLTGAMFSNTLLEKVDFRTATNFSIDPEFNRLKKAKFSAFQLEGLLYKYQLEIDYSNQ
jgi:fluoroquinolone resistance protein